MNKEQIYPYANDPKTRADIYQLLLENDKLNFFPKEF